MKINQDDGLFWHNTQAQTIQSYNQYVAKGRIKYIRLHKPTDKGCTDKNAAIAEQLSHRRMAHANMKVIKAMMRNIKYGMRSRDRPQAKECETCMYARQAKASTVRNLTGSNQNITLYMDIFGPIRETTNRDKQYFLTRTKTPYQHIYDKPILRKSNAKDLRLVLIALLERNTGTTAKRVHCDNAKEFVSIKPVWKKLIIFMLSSAYSPQLNSLVERVNRTLMDKVRAFLKDSNLDGKYRGEALRHAAYLYNRLTSPVFQFNIPFEALLNRFLEIDRSDCLGAQRTCTNLKQRGRPNYRITPIW